MRSSGRMDNEGLWPSHFSIARVDSISLDLPILCLWYGTPQTPRASPSRLALPCPARPHPRPRDRGGRVGRTTSSFEVGATVRLALDSICSIRQENLRKGEASR